jgi:hypothetical protein
LYSTTAPRLIIKFPNQVEDKLWALSRFMSFEFLRKIKVCRV